MECKSTDEPLCLYDVKIGGFFYIDDRSPKDKYNVAFHFPNHELHTSFLAILSISLYWFLPCVIVLIVSR